MPKMNILLDLIWVQGSPARLQHYRVSIPSPTGVRHKEKEVLRGKSNFKKLTIPFVRVEGSPTPFLVILMLLC